MNKLSQKRSAWVYALDNPTILLSVLISGIIGALSLLYVCYKLAQRFKVIAFIKENIHIIIECAPYVIAFVAGCVLVSFIFKNIVYNVVLYNAMKYLPLTVAELNEHSIATCDQMDIFLKETMFTHVHRGKHIDADSIYRDLVKSYEIVIDIEKGSLDHNAIMIEANKRAAEICNWLKMN